MGYPRRSDPQGVGLQFNVIMATSDLIFIDFCKIISKLTKTKRVNCGQSEIAMFKELQLVALTRDLQEHNLKSGDVGPVALL